MSKEEKYIEIKKRDLIIAAICVFCLVYAALYSANQDSEMLADMFTTVYFVIFPIFSVFMGCYISVKTKKVLFPTAFWAVYCFIIDIMLVKEMDFPIVMSFLCILLFFVSALITKSASPTKKDEQDKQ